MKYGFNPEVKQKETEVRHLILKSLMIEAQKSMARQKQKGVKFKQIAEEIGISKRRISDVYRGRFVSKKTISLLIGYGYLKIDNVLPNIPAEHIKVLTRVIPIWA